MLDETIRKRAGILSPAEQCQVLDFVESLCQRHAQPDPAPAQAPSEFKREIREEEGHCEYCGTTISATERSAIGLCQSCRGI